VINVRRQNSSDIIRITAGSRLHTYKLHILSMWQTLCSTGVRKRLYPFLFLVLSCPVCGEWCKLHWLLLDTPSFDWNTRRSREHKILISHQGHKEKFLKKVQSFSDTLYIERSALFKRAVTIQRRPNKH
jgi:hypothetical protein